MSVAHAPIKDTSHLGWDALPEMHRKFVRAFLECGDQEQATVKAGYVNDKHLPTRARQLRKILDGHIKAQLESYATSADFAILGLSTLKNLALEAESETVRLNAAKSLIEKALPEKIKESTVTHNINIRKLSDDDLEKRVLELQGKLGMIPKDIEGEVVRVEG